jgi:hypothetical protein
MKTDIVILSKRAFEPFKVEIFFDTKQEVLEMILALKKHDCETRELNHLLGDVIEKIKGAAELTWKDVEDYE